MRIAARWIPAALLVWLSAAHATAQWDEDPAAPDPVPADSMDVTPLDEQLAGAGEEEDVEREGGETATGRPRGGPWRFRWRVRASSLLQSPAAYLRDDYAGNRLKLYQRLDIRGGSTFRAALLTEKDPGESDPADFISGAVTAGDLAGGFGVTAGDFRLRSGQGLLFGSARSFGKGAAVIEPVVRESWGIPDGLSSDEANFFRGAALGAGYGALSAIVFGSVRRLSPIVAPDGRLRGVDRSGYHRTVTELGRRDRLLCRSAGGLLRFSAGEALTFGVGFLRSSYESRDNAVDAPVPVIPPYGRASLDLKALAGPLTVFGEAVLSGLRPAWIAGLLAAPSGGVKVVLARRRYPAVPEPARTFGFADASTGRNEEGVYIAVETRPFHDVMASGYVDLFSSPAPGTGAVFPPSGADRSISVQALCGGFRMEARYRSRLVQEKQPSRTGREGAAPLDRTRRTDRARFALGWSAAAGISCRIRLEHCVTSPGTRGESDRGVTGAAELTLSPVRGMKLRAMLELFGADSDASGFTTVEPDLPGTLAGTNLSGEGSNWFLLWSHSISRHVRISMKYSRFRRDDVQRIGSGGAGELPSNIREKAGVQLDVGW